MNSTTEYSTINKLKLGFHIALECKPLYI